MNSMNCPVIIDRFDSIFRLSLIECKSPMISLVNEINMSDIPIANISAHAAITAVLRTINVCIAMAKRYFVGLLKSNGNLSKRKNMFEILKRKW